MQRDVRVTLKKRKGLALEKYVDCGQNSRNDDGTHCTCEQDFVVGALYL